jgi:hypothetical protein
MGVEASDFSDAAPSADDEGFRAHKRGLQRSDEVVQQLAVAKYALSVGDIPRAMAAIDAALGFARRSLTDLLTLVNPTPATPQQRRYAGAMVRETPADARPARMQAAPHDVAARRRGGADQVREGTPHP